MANKIAGLAFVKVDGDLIELGESLSFAPASIERESMRGLSGPTGFKEMPISPFVEMEVHLVDTFDLKAISDTTSATVTLEAANGWTHTLAEAWLVGRPEGDSAEGKSTLRFESKREMTSVPPPST